MSSTSSLKSNYKRFRRRKSFILLGGLIILALFSIIFTSLGITDSNIFSVVDTLKNYIKGIEPSNTGEKVILNLRLPRTILAILSGIGLSCSGCVMQGITRNPLVSPFTIGVSSAASFGAALAIVSGVGFFGNTPLGIVTNAFISAFLCATFVFTLAKRKSLKPESLILTGIALNYLFQALSTSVQFVAEDSKLAAVVAWTFGSLNGASWKEVYFIFWIILVGLILLFTQHRSLTLMASMEDDITRTMGVKPEQTRVLTSLLSVLMTASIISFTGIIGFVGLAAPHISRSLIGNDYKLLVPMSAISGAILVLVSDTIGRLLLSPVIIPVGIVVSFVGVPIFVHQVILNRRN